MESVKQKSKAAYAHLDGIFTSKEAWALYKFIAIAETIGWTLLLGGIFSKIYKWPYYDWTLALSGSIHGMIFVAYILIVVFAHRSMKWTVWEFVTAEVVSNVPFGALAFEQWVIRKYKR